MFDSVHTFYCLIQITTLDNIEGDNDNRHAIFHNMTEKCLHFYNESKINFAKLKLATINLITINYYCFGVNVFVPVL